MKSFDTLKDKHAGRPAVVMGAGPDLPAQMTLCPPGAVLISINQRPARWTKSDYIVFLDYCTGPLVEGLPGERVSPWEEFTDYRFENHVWKGNLSGTTALYLACYAGCSPVVLAGIDCYRGTLPYFDSPAGEPFLATAAHRGLEWHLEEWGKAFHHCVNPGAIRAVDGPLVEVFGKYEA